MYRYIAGLDKDRPGYKHILIRPCVLAGLTRARASYQSVYGEIVSGWELRQGKMRVHALIPANTTATIQLPGADPRTIVEGGSGIQTVPDFTQNGADVWLEVGSGSYVFEYAYRIPKI